MSRWVSPCRDVDVESDFFDALDQFGVMDLLQWSPLLYFLYRRQSFVRRIRSVTRGNVLTVEKSRQFEHVDIHVLNEIEITGFTRLISWCDQTFQSNQTREESQWNTSSIESVCFFCCFSVNQVIEQLSMSSSSDSLPLQKRKEVLSKVEWIDASNVHNEIFLRLTWIQLYWRVYWNCSHSVRREHSRLIVEHVEL